MIERITSINNPNFFFMHYNKSSLKVENFVMVPKYFFSLDIIEKRKPLAETARRFIVQNEKEIPIEQIIDKIHRTEFLRGSKLDARGWTLDVLKILHLLLNRCINLRICWLLSIRIITILKIKYDNSYKC